MVVRRSALKASLKDFNIPTESWEQNRTKWRGLIKRGAGEYEAKRISEAEQSRNVHSGKAELRHHQQSFLPQTTRELLSEEESSATGRLELRLVSSAILEHTNNNTSQLGLVIFSNDRRTTLSGE